MLIMDCILCMYMLIFRMLQTRSSVWPFFSVRACYTKLKSFYMYVLSVHIPTMQPCIQTSST
jgi:hypothetical protein